MNTGQVTRTFPAEIEIQLDKLRLYIKILYGEMEYRYKGDGKVSIASGDFSGWLYLLDDIGKTAQAIDNGIWPEETVKVAP
jgi:hypothetical protein